MTLIQIVAAAALSAQPQPSVVMHSHAAQWVEVQGNSLFRFEAMAKNTLDIPLSGIDIGVVYANDESALEVLEPSELYSDVSAIKIGASTVALRLTIFQTIPAKSSVRVRWEIPSSQALLESSIKPRAFVSHLLGYRFASSPLSIMDELLKSDLAADEWSIMESLGRVSLGRSLFEARENWQPTTTALERMTVLFEPTIPLAPEQALVFKWVVRIIALGVMGGEQALEVLTELESRSDLSNLDEGFQVLRLARLTNTVYESPLAFSFPTPTANIRDLLQYAMELCTQEFKEEPEDMPAAVGGANLGLLEKSDPKPSMKGVGFGLLIGFCLGVIGILLWNSRRKVGKQEHEH